jgi:flavin-dependent dehydrogenase
VALARGLSFALDRSEFSATILCDHLAPRGYIYFLVAEGQATLGTVQVGDLRGSTQRLQAAVDAVERRWEFRVPATAAAWAGHAGFAIPRHCMRGRTLVVGEAAGFQDALFGFGIRSTAMLSGALAAISLSGGRTMNRPGARGCCLTCGLRSSIVRSTNVRAPQKACCGTF